MALGFLVEKLTVFLASSGTGGDELLAAVPSAEKAGLVLLLAAMAMIVSSTIRLLHLRRLIASEELRPYAGAIQQVVLALLLVLVGVFSVP